MSRLDLWTRGLLLIRHLFVELAMGAQNSSVDEGRTSFRFLYGPRVMCVHPNATG